MGEPWICPLNITTQLAPRDMRGREEAHAEKNKGTAVEYELLGMYSLFPFKNRLRYIGLRLQRIVSDFHLIFKCTVQ